MIIKGGARGKGAQLAAHLLRTDTNETVQLLDRQGVVATDVRGAFAEMEAIASGSRATKPLYHVSLSPEAHEVLTSAQWRIAADRLGDALGLDGRQRVMVFHKKDGREHCHVVWNRVDAETLKAAHHSHNYRTHEEVARALEAEFGLNRTQGVHAERDGEKKPRERPTTKESQQEARSGWKKADAKDAIGGAWENSENGEGFRHMLEENGYRLARGDKRDFVIIDPKGGVHSLRSGVKGLRVAEIRDRFADLDPASLPSVAEAKKAALEGKETPQRQAEIADRTGAVSTVRANLPPPGYRPSGPSPSRYGVLHQTPEPRPTPLPQPSTPRPEPTPPSWAREEASALPPPPVQAAPPVTKPVEPALPLSPAARGLKARQDAEWAQTSARIANQHSRARAELAVHHERRLATLTTGIDQRLAELNGLASRAGALFDPTDRDREIAYLVARRQRTLVAEKDRQDKVQDDLRRAQAKEIETAKGKHDRLAALQLQTLEKREAGQQGKDEAARPLPPRPRREDYER